MGVKISNNPKKIKVYINAAGQKIAEEEAFRGRAGYNLGGTGRTDSLRTEGTEPTEKKN